MKIRILIPVLCLFSICSFAQSFKYDLSKPIFRKELPEILDEVSGITQLSSSRLACVQDELGIVFVYDLKTNEITSRHNFDSIGDFEGITMVKNSLFILRSDGRLTEWKNFPDNNNSIRHFKLAVETSNNEGLCYDAKNNRLLIGAKGKPQNHDKKSERFIYAFNLSSMSLEETKPYSIDVKMLAEQAPKFNVPTEHTNAKGNIKPLNFRPSEIAVHPKTDDIYILSAEDQLLTIINRKGDILYMKTLDTATFPKAEGLTFLEDGTMIISNEAEGKKATLLGFEMMR